MEVMTDVLVGWVEISRNPSCMVSKAVARAGLATGGLTKIVSHHELRWRGLAPEDERGDRSPTAGSFFSENFRNTRSSRRAPPFAGAGGPGSINSKALRAGNRAARGRVVQGDC